MKKSILVLFASGIGLLNAQTNQTLQLTLKQAIANAEANNVELKKGKIDIDLSKETVRQTTAIGLPQVNISGGYQQFITIPGQWVKNFSGPNPEYLFLQFQQQIASSGTLSVNQLLFDGSYIVALKASNEFSNLSKLVYAKTLNDVQFNVSKAYLMVATTEKNISVINANIEVLEKSLSNVKEVNKEGFAEKLDVQRISLALGNLKVQKEKLENAVSTLKNILKLQLGVDMSTNIELTETIEQINEQITMAEIEKNNLNTQSRIEYQLINQSIKLGDLDKKRYQMAYLPRLVGFYQHQQSTQRPEFNFFKSGLTRNNSWVPSNLIGLQLQMNLFSGFGDMSKIKECELKISKAKLDLQNFESAANMQFLNASNNYNTQLKQASVQKENLDLANQIYETANLKFKEGVGSSIEVMQAETELKSAQNNYLSAVYDLIISKLDYYQATGKNIK